MLPDASDSSGEVQVTDAAVIFVPAEPHWACYHTVMYNFTHDGLEYGIIGNVVGAAFSEGILTVEMEAAALYAFAQARSQNVVCFAHVTNQMGNVENDFEKGVAQGSLDALQVIGLAARGWLG